MLSMQSSGKQVGIMSILKVLGSPSKAFQVVTTSWFGLGLSPPSAERWRLCPNGFNAGTAGCLALEEFWVGGIGMVPKEG